MNKLKQKIIGILRQLPVCIPAKSETQWVVRCPYCGDSKDPTHAHLSIHIDVTQDDDSMRWRCFKCNASFGAVTEELLIDLGCDITDELIAELKAFNKSSFKKSDYHTTNNNIFIPENIDIDKSILMNTKAEYIGNRLGISPSDVIKNARDWKIILDLPRFIRANNIKNIESYSDKRILFMNYNYVGFLSSNKNCIILRCIRDDKECRRYDKIIIDPKNLNKNTFYNIPFDYDRLSLDSVDIHIAEGIFDILGVYWNVNNQNTDNNMYFACCGYGYNTILKYLIFNGITTNVSIHIYADNDKSDNDIIEHLSRKNPLPKIWFDYFYIHRNIYTHSDGTHEKDYGVINIHDHKRPIKL